MASASINQRNYAICLLNAAAHYNNSDTVLGVWFASTPTVDSGEMSKFVKRLRSNMTPAEIKAAGRAYYPVKTGDKDLTVRENNPVKNLTSDELADMALVRAMRANRAKAFVPPVRDESDMSILVGGKLNANFYSGIKSHG